MPWDKTVYNDPDRWGKAVKAHKFTASGLLKNVRV
jgi:hypothetical protein